MLKFNEKNVIKSLKANGVCVRDESNILKKKTNSISLVFEDGKKTELLVEDVPSKFQAKYIWHNDPVSGSIKQDNYSSPKSLCSRGNPYLTIGRYDEIYKMNDKLDGILKVYCGG